MGVRVLRTPVSAPTADSFCEPFGGTLHRECLDLLIPFNERYLKFVLKVWVTHFNHARPHMSLGPGIPAALRPPAQESAHRHRIPKGYTVRRAAVLGGLPMSIGSRKSLRELRMDFLRSTGLPIPRQDRHRSELRTLVPVSEEDQTSACL
jgi:hypothetical protein